MKYLNLGCGKRFHPDWTNIDIIASSPHVQVHDLSKGIPFPADTFDVVYHSHLLEHFKRDAALRFTQECYRVLKSGGIIRVALPDLECIARTYLKALERALEGDDEWKCNYEWMVLELYDQTVRERTGGALLEYLKQDPIPNEAFVYERLGGEARQIVQALRNKTVGQDNPRPRKCDFLYRVRYFLRCVRANLIRRLLGERDYRALQIGRFRIQGEVHQWMYDRYSLAQLLKQVGFQHPQLVGPTESRIPGWKDYNLDTDPDGTVYKTDSLYMEAFKL
ncbi:MAG TPA: methyltransferase domain-containing protein [Desulfobacterales bacterium]|nr:methyltransferase domain-containing protein [Desulfobacterales bacterium]